MDQGSQKIILNLPADIWNELQILSRNLGINPGEVLIKGLVFFRMAQGRKVIFKTEKSDIDIQTAKYQNQPVRTEVS